MFHLSTATANQSCPFPGSLTIVAFSPTWGVHILWYTCYPRMTPDAEKEHTWDCCCGCRCHLSLPTMSWSYRKCALALYINGDRQRWPSTFGARTIRIEFPESDTSLEITSLKCCILTQNRPPSLASFPDLPVFCSLVCVQYNTWKWKSGEKPFTWM